MRVFRIVWFGQLISIICSGLTDFALGLWVYDRTDSITQFSLILLARTLPVILLSPVAGAYVDRLDKRRIMIGSDAGAALGSLTIAILLFAGELQVWHVYVAAMFSAVCGTFQLPAYQTAITALVPPSDFGRANGLVQLGQAIAEILTPLLAGMLVVAIKLRGVLIIDVSTFLFSIVTLAAVRFPPLPGSARDAKRLLRAEIAEGARYIGARPGLVGLLFLFAALFFQGGLISALVQPIVLGFASAAVLGVVLAVAGVGLLSGSLLLTTWGGPTRRVQGILIFVFLFGISIMLIGLRPWPVLVAVGAFCAHFCFPFINGCNQAIWQHKVAPAIQGRVFAIRQMAVRGAQPLAYLLAGPLAQQMGHALDVHEDRGAAAIFLVMGGLFMLIAVLGYLSPRLRLLEDELPDAVPSQPALPH